MDRRRQRMRKGKSAALKWHLLVALILLAGSFIVPQARADELNAIQAAIAAQDAKWVAGETSMSRLSLEERKMRLGARVSVVKDDDTFIPEPEARAATALPPAIDWRDNNGNWVTSVKDQYACGGCWAFSAAAALESLVLRTRRTPGVNVDLSEQVMISCSGAGSCRFGGSQSEAAAFLKLTGLPLDSCYGFQGMDTPCGDACPGWQSSAHKIAQWSWVNAYGRPASVSAIKNALYTYGPLVTMFNVFNDFHNYTGGIYSHVAGDEEGLHSVLLVGYNDGEGGYFIVKNSWGDYWGESGFFRIAYSQVANEVEFGAETIAYMPLLPKIALSPGSLNFGAVKTGGSSNGKTVTIRNSGKGELALGALGITGTNQSEFSQSDNCGGFVASASSCAVTVSASPRAPYGNKTAKLQVPSNDANKPTSSVTLVANASPPKIVVVPGSINFGAVTGSNTRTLNVRNTGVSDLTVSSVVKTGPGAAYFTLTGSVAIIAPREQGELQITFTPDSKTVRAASLEITSDDPAKKGRPVVVRLSGKGK
jgi:C1A family cysteine protease